MLPLTRFRVWSSFIPVGNVVWLTWDQTVPYVARSGSVMWQAGKVRECDVASWQLQGCSPHVCWLRTDGLTPASKYWIYWSHDGDMDLVSWCSSVTTWLNLLSPSPRLSQGRMNEVTQGNDWVSLSLVIKTSSRCRGLFWPRGGLAKGCYTWTLWDV
jgi:hypothetical protein